VIRSIQRWRSGAVLVGVTLLGACTLSFDLPTAVDAGPADDAANAIDAADVESAYSACLTPFDSVSVNTLEAADFEVDREDGY
jgi:hypothetical protein